MLGLPCLLLWEVSLFYVECYLNQNSYMKMNIIHSKNEVFSITAMISLFSFFFVSMLFLQLKHQIYIKRV